MTNDTVSAGKRLFGHASWTAADHVLRLGLTRLVCFPLIAKFLGESEFGAFVVAITIAMMFGGAISQGLSNFILREVSRFGDQDADRVKRSCVALSLLVTIAVFGIIGLFWWVFGFQDPTGNTQFWLSVFAAHYVILNPSETSLAFARLDRNFRMMALTHLAGALAMVAGVLLFPYLSRWGIVLGIMMWAIIPMLLARKLIPAGEHWIARDHSKQIMITSSFFAISALVALSGGYLDRLVLAIWWPPEDVASFFAAVSLGMLLSAPGLVFSQLAMSLLGKATELSRFPPRFLIGYLVANLCLAAALFVIGRPVGKHALQWLYPTQAPTAIPLWDYAVGAAACTIMVSMLRPFINKFSPASYLPVLSSTSLLVKLPLLWILVPTGGMIGAGQALLSGSFIMSLMWIAAFLTLLKGAAKTEPIGAVTNETTVEPKTQP